MNLKLTVWAVSVLAAGFAVARPSWAQIEPDPQTDPSLLRQSQAEVLQADPAEPLQVTQQQRDQFFTPAPAPRPIRAESGIVPESERLIQPPPGSQTPAQLTPGQRLNIPLR